MSNNRFEGIEIFVQVIKSNGFNAAAEKLGHSSSHVSKVINKLETRIGTRLVNRTTRSIALTPEGEVFYQHCVQLMIDAEQAVDLITHNQLNPKGVLKISCPIGFNEHYLRPVVTKYLDRYPNVSLDWDLSDKKIDVIADGYDLAIRAAPQLDESSLICKRIYSTRSYVIVSKSYIEKFGRPHHPFELAQHHCICYANLKNPTRWVFVDQNGDEVVVDVKQKIRCNHGQTQLAMVLAGQGITRLPGFYLKEVWDHPELEILFEEFVEPQINVYAVYPSRKHLSAKVRTFIDLLTDEIAN